MQKVVFLGAGSSGKSTFFKQLSYLYIHSKGYPKKELERHIHQF